MPLPARQKVPKGRPAQDGATITDPRFANIHTDPRFRLPSKKHTKTKIDARFSRMLKDKEFSRKASVDKYGRRLAKNEGKKELERFYRVDDEDEEDNEEETSRDKAVRKELARLDKKRDYDPIRDGGFSSSSSEDGSSESEEEEEEQEVQDEAEIAEPAAEVPMGDVTKRLAAVNMDWDNIRATDIMAVASSFVPSDSKIVSVTIYPSEFGRQRMEREEIEGPPREIFASTSREVDSGDQDPDVASSSEDELDEDRIKKDLLKEDTGEDFDSKALRAYQLDRLRYYYAVIECSSPEAAKAIYDNLDGREYLSSANFFDLRFVPDEVPFDEKPHDVCEKLLDSYQPNEFTTDALTHSKVKLTWDADDTTRKEAQKRAFSRKEIDENDLKAYLGSDSSSSEDEADDKKAEKAAKLRAALGLGDDDASFSKSKSSTKRDRDFKKPQGEMQITFTAGISASDKKNSVFENEPIIDETTMEKYIRKQKERKQKRKERAKAIREGRDPDAAADGDSHDDSGDESGEAGDEEDPWNDPFFNDDADAKPSKSQQRKLKKEQEREEREKRQAESDAQRAELELLMLDDEAQDMKHFDMNEIMKAEKAAKKKGKKSKKTKDVDQSLVQDEFEMNTEDPRFAKVFESHEFAIDPTNPRFKATRGMKKLLEEGRKKRKHEIADGEDEAKPATSKKSKKEGGADAAGDLDDLKKLAARVKARSKKVS